MISRKMCKLSRKKERKHESKITGREKNTMEWSLFFESRMEWDKIARVYKEKSEFKEMREAGNMIAFHSVLISISSVCNHLLLAT